MCYQFTDLRIRNYVRVKLSTSSKASAEKIKGNIKMGWLKVKLYADYETEQKK